MVTAKPVDTREPKITHEEILFLQDENFNSKNVCVVSGAGTGIGRATAIAAAANNLMTVGLDINPEEGDKTAEMVACMSSKGFGQVGHKNKRGFQIPNTFFQFVKQPLMSNYTSCVEASYFS